MKFKISGNTLELEKSKGEWKFTPRPGGWFIAERTLEDGSLQRNKVMLAKSGNKTWFHGRGRTYTGEWTSSSKRGGASAGASESDLTAQFPGKVRKILVKAGDQVEKGTPLLLLEAMKMEFKINAPFSGKIKGIPVQEGQQLAPGTLLVDFESTPEKKSGEK